MLRYMVMQVCHELGKDEQDIAQWSYQDLIRWVGFFRLKNKYETEAIKKAQARASKAPRGMGSGGPTQVFIE